jgi:hypothetical protein
MEQNNHPRAIFGANTTKGAGFNGHSWDISLIDKSEHICEPERDRRIIYGVPNGGSMNCAEARIRESYNGTRVELLIFVWSDSADDSTHGIRVIQEDVPVEDLDTVRKCRAYLKCVARVTESLAKEMGKLDSVIDAGWDKITDF